MMEMFKGWQVVDVFDLTCILEVVKENVIFPTRRTRETGLKVFHQENNRTEEEKPVSFLSFIRSCDHDAIQL